MGPHRGGALRPAISNWLNSDHASRHARNPRSSVAYGFSIGIEQNPATLTLEQRNAEAVLQLCD
jgi:hypothetical protein